MIKKQGLKPKFKPIARGGWKKEQYLKQNLIINYELFLEYREKILIMRECLKLIKNLTATETTI